MSNLTIFRVVLLLVPCAMLNSLGMDVFAPAMPEMMNSLGTTEQKIQYIVIFFMLAVGIGQPLIGILCDKFGRRPVLLFSVFLFVAASFFATVSSSVEQLALSRFFEGLGACGSLVVTFAVVNDSFCGRDAFRVFSLIGCALSLTPMLAPLLGVGLMHFSGSWEVCFHFLGLFGLGAALFCYLFLPETKPSDTVIPNFGNLIANHKAIFNKKQFVAYALFGTTAMAQLYLYFSIGSLLFINQLGVSPFGFSMIFAFNALIFLAGNYLSIFLQLKRSAFYISAAGSVLIIIGSLLMIASQVFQGLSLAGLMFSNTIMTIGVGLMIGPATGAALQPFKKLAGTASGVFGTLQYGLPAVVGLIVTRFPIQTSLSIALPMLFLSVISLLAGLRYRSQFVDAVAQTPVEI
jgi:MFS transporter, DHA1 family, multidrug resistance protein